MPVRLKTVPGRIVLEKSDQRETAVPFRAEIPAATVADITVEPAPWIGSALTLMLTCGRRIIVELPTKPPVAHRLADNIRRGIGVADLQPGDLVVVAAPATRP